MVQRLQECIVKEGFDAGVRFGEHLAQDMIAVSLGPPEWYAVVASPDLVAACGKPKHPKDLLDLPRILTRFPSGALLDWEFEKAGRVIKLTPKATVIGTNPAFLLCAAIDGLGFVMAFKGFVRDTVKSGSLVRPGGLVSGFSGTASLLPKSSSAAASAKRLHCVRSGMAEWRK